MLTHSSLCSVASFGPPSMSMPTGFGNTAAYNLPTSFSGNFQQAFPGQPFTQPHAYPQQPNGKGSEKLYNSVHRYAAFCRMILLYFSKKDFHMVTFFCSHLFVLLGGFAAFGQGKVAPFGQNMTGPGITNNPFLVSKRTHFCKTAIFIFSFILLIMFFLNIYKVYISFQMLIWIFYLFCKIFLFLKLSMLFRIY